MRQSETPQTAVSAESASAPTNPISSAQFNEFLGRVETIEGMIHKLLETHV